jgi:hypothetical protein
MKMSKQYDMITDYITGKSIPDAGAEANRQAVERLLVEEKGFLPSDIFVDMPVKFKINGKEYFSFLDLVVFVEKKPFMVIKCAAGSLDSRQKEVVSAARILSPDFIVPYAAASDGKTAYLYDAVSGKQIKEGRHALPDFSEALEMSRQAKSTCLPEKRLEKEYLIFKSYDSMNVNAIKKGQDGPG